LDRVTTTDETPHDRHRELLWLLGAIGVLLAIGLAILIAVVLVYRSGNIRGHPLPTATPVRTETPVTRP
jgi:hypothetical protein